MRSQGREYGIDCSDCRVRLNCLVALARRRCFGDPAKRDAIPPLSLRSEQLASDGLGKGQLSQVDRSRCLASSAHHSNTSSTRLAALPGSSSSSTTTSNPDNTTNLLNTLWHRVSILPHHTPPLGPPGERLHRSAAILLEETIHNTSHTHIHQPTHIMARYSRDQRRRSSPTTSPWMTMFYICALVFAPMLLMGMLPSANAQEDAKDTSVTGPGKLAIPVKSPFLENIQLTCLA
jgi:hypothetical protein